MTNLGLEFTAVVAIGGIVIELGRYLIGRARFRKLKARVIGCKTSNRKGTYSW